MRSTAADHGCERRYAEHVSLSRGSASFVALTTSLAARFQADTANDMLVRRAHGIQTAGLAPDLPSVAAGHPAAGLQQHGRLQRQGHKSPRAVT